MHGWKEEARLSERGPVEVGQSVVAERGRSVSPGNDGSEYPYDANVTEGPVWA